MSSWLEGVYLADRAAALSGVPKSTVYYWARNEIWTPTLSEGRPMVWAYRDLLALRLIYWLRQAKPDLETLRSSMPRVRQLLNDLQKVGEQPGSPSVSVRVDRKGKIVAGAKGISWEPQGGAATGHLQLVAPEAIRDVFAEFPTEEGRIGPDLRHPRPHLRIVPGKLSGEPHVQGTRIPSRSVAALRRDGLSDDQILRFYPSLSRVSVHDCLTLEDQLRRNAA
jgi:uncharacterized protein (DUF433 family)